jgi:predicted DNA-binding transcriptional regulator AlpA
VREILTVKEVAAMLKVSQRHVYEMTNERTVSGDIREHPLPVFRMGRVVRFVKEDVEKWIDDQRGTRS